MIGRGIILGLLLLVAMAASEAKERAPLESLLDSYAGHMSRGEFQQAVTVARKIRREMKKDPKGDLLLVAAELRTEDFWLGKERLRKLERKHPDLPGLAAQKAFAAYTELEDDRIANADRQPCDRETMLELYVDAVAEDPGNLGLRVEHANALSSSGYWSDAYGAYFDWMRRNPRNTVAKMMMIESLSRSGHFAEAIQESESTPQQLRDVASFVIFQAASEQDADEWADKVASSLEGTRAEPWFVATRDVYACLDDIPSCDTTQVLLNLYASKIPSRFGHRVVGDYQSFLVEHPMFIESDAIETPPPNVPSTSGKVTLRLLIDEKGVVRRVEVLRAPRYRRKEFAGITTKALMKWRFDPATFNGEPIAIHHTMNYVFNVNYR